MVGDKLLSVWSKLNLWRFCAVFTGNLLGHVDIEVFHGGLEISVYCSSETASKESSDGTSGIFGIPPKICMRVSLSLMSMQVDC